VKHQPHAVPERENNLAFETHLTELRIIEQFVPEDYLHAKSLLISEYLKANRLDTVVVAVSGGVDSACVLALAKHTQKKHPNVLKRIVAVTLPAPNSKGVTGQPETVRKAKLLEAYDVEVQEVDMTQGLGASLEAIQKASEAKELSPWAEGQVVPYMRTAWLYGVTASLADQGCRAVLLGTTNKDEGAYLGYFGKASDGLVDVQPISDLHKNQVWAVARALGVAESICAAVPTGDMYDGRRDEEVFGATYNEVEWAIRLMESTKSVSAEAAFDVWLQTTRVSLGEKTRLRQAMKNIDALHAYNAHKYIGASPAVHLDLWPCRLKNGWRTNASIFLPQERVSDPTTWVNPCVWGETPNPRNVEKVSLERGPQGILVFRNLLSKTECAEWRAWANDPKGDPWSRANEYGKTGVKSTSVGSWRKTTFNQDWSREIYNRLAKAGLPRHYLPIYPHSDRAKDGLVWTRVGLSEVWRWIKYTPGDGLVPHYDDTYAHSSHKKTLMSVVMYLSEGETRFLSDPRFPTTYEDWPTLWEGPVDYTVKANPGDVVVFDHRLFHDGPKVSKEKIIVRTDVVYEKPSLGGALEHH
jgi:NAD+ synthetase